MRTKPIGRARCNLDGREYNILAKTGSEVMLSGRGWVHVFSVTILTLA